MRFEGAASCSFKPSCSHMFKSPPAAKLNVRLHICIMHAAQVSALSLCSSEQCCCGTKRCHSAIVCRLWPSEPILSCPNQLLSRRPLFLSRGSTRLCEDDLHLDSCAFAGHCSCSLAFHCHPTPVQPGLSHRTLNPVNESRPLFQAFFIPIPATSPRWNATRMPATGYLALESLCAETGEAERERGSRKRTDSTRFALQGALQV